MSCWSYCNYQFQMFWLWTFGFSESQYFKLCLKSKQMIWIPHVNVYGNLLDIVVWYWNISTSTIHPISCDCCFIPENFGSSCQVQSGPGSNPSNSFLDCVCQANFPPSNKHLINGLLSLFLSFLPDDHRLPPPISETITNIPLPIYH